MSETRVPVQNAFQLVDTTCSDLRFTIQGFIPTGTAIDFALDHKIVKLDKSEEFGDKMFQVIFEVKINSVPDALMNFRAIYNVIFKCEKDITPDFFASPLIQINATAIAFPFVRSYVATVTANSGIPAIYLPALNFAKQQRKTATT